MTTILSVLSKGGDGKTTSTGAMGAALADLGANVLLVDLDRQPSLTQWLAPGWSGPSVADVMEHGQWRTALVPVAGRPDLALMPGSPALGDVDPELAVAVMREVIPQLGRWDVVLIDTPAHQPLGESLTLHAAALAVADMVLIPFQPLPFTVKAMPDLQVDLVAARSLTGRALPVALLPTQTRATRITRILLEGMAVSPDLLPAVRARAGVVEAQALGELLADYSPAADAARDYATAAAVLAARLALPTGVVA